MNRPHLSLAILAATLIAAALPLHAESPVPSDYPLKTCPVSGDPLGEHGKPIKVSADGTDVWLCCKMCRKDFDKDPAKFVKQVREASAKK